MKVHIGDENYVGESTKVNNIEGHKEEEKHREEDIAEPYLKHYYLHLANIY